MDSLRLLLDCSIAEVQVNLLVCMFMYVLFSPCVMAYLQPQSHNSTSSDKDGGDTSPSSVWTTFASLNKARMKFNMKLLGQQFTLTSPRTPTASAKARRMFVL